MILIKSFHGRATQQSPGSHGALIAFVSSFLASFSPSEVMKEDDTADFNSANRIINELLKSHSNETRSTPPPAPTAFHADILIVIPARSTPTKYTFRGVKSFRS